MNDKIGGKIRYSTPVSTYLNLNDDETPIDKYNSPIFAQSLSQDCESNQHVGGKRINCRLRELVNANLDRMSSSSGAGGGDSSNEIVGYLAYLTNSREFASQ